MWIYLNNRFVSKEEAKISVFDHGFLYGDGVFETLRAYHGKFLMLSEHIARLEQSAARLHIAMPVKRSRLSAIVAESLELNKLTDAYLRITVSRGQGEIGLDPALCKTPTLVVIAKPFEPYPESFYTDGVAVAVVQTRRNLPEALPPHVKSLNYLNNILAKMEATALGAYDAVLLNHHGEVTEGTTSNVFVALGGRLLTPAHDCGILVGITRNLVLQLARELEIPTEETQLTAADLPIADECFLTNTTVEVLPVTQVDGQKIGDGRPGEITRRLHASFRDSLDRFLDSR
jgi:branched-chain amino acid aminotransferase